MNKNLENLSDDTETERRKIEEMSFHDQRERDRLALSADEFQRKYTNKKWYAITERSTAFLDNWLADHAKGAVALDYCCGLGGTSVRLARVGAVVHGIDISPESVATARKRLAEAGFAESATMQVMDAEHTTFADNTFDVIVCIGVLHHLDVTKAFPELCRIVKPNGLILAAEALGLNPVIKAYRRRTPHLRTAWEAEHILTHKDLSVAKQYFDTLDIHYFHLFSILATPFRKTWVFKPLLAALNWVDSWALRIPGVQLMAWQMIFVLGKPRK